MDHDRSPIHSGVFLRYRKAHGSFRFMRRLLFNWINFIVSCLGMIPFLLIGALARVFLWVSEFLNDSAGWLVLLLGWMDKHMTNFSRRMDSNRSTTNTKDTE